MGLFSFIGGLIGGDKQAKATKKAGRLQYDAAMAGLDETKRQFDTTRADYQPYQQLGASAAPFLGDLIGLNGNDAQQSQIDALKSGPLYSSLVSSGEDSLLANASATGGLRGGNTEDSLSRFRSDTLNSVIADKLSQYSGAVGIGSGATGAVANFGANAVAQGNAQRNAGAGALAQSALVRGGIAAQNWSNAGSFLDSTISSALGGGGGGGFNWSSLF